MNRPGLSSDGRGRAFESSGKLEDCWKVSGGSYADGKCVSFERSLKLQPDRPNVLKALAALYLSMGESVRGLDCLDETPLLDIKPDRCEFTPLAPPQPGDFQTE